MKTKTCECGKTLAADAKTPGKTGPKIQFTCRHVLEALQALRGADSGGWTQQGDALVCDECE